MSLKSKIEQATTDSVDWDRIDSRMISVAHDAARVWGGRYGLEPEDLAQEALLFMAARPEKRGSIWWVVKRLAHDEHTRRQLLPTAELDEEGWF